MLNLKNLKYIFLCLLIVSGLYFAILLVNSFNNKPDIKDIGVIKFDNIISNQSLTSSQELILDNQNDEDFSYKLIGIRSGGKDSSVVVKKANKDGFFELSVKDLEIQEEKEALKEYGSSSSGASIGEIIGAALEEDKKKSKDETK